MKNIAFCIGKNYAQHFCVSLRSLVEYNMDFTLWLIHDGVEKKTLDFSQKLSKKIGFDLNEIYVDDNHFNNLKTNYHLTKASYYRLLLPEILPKEMQTILYLDADLIVRTDLQELFSMDVSDKCLAAVEDVGFLNHEQLHMDKNASYFCSGVMMINLKMWRNQNIKEKVIAFIEKYPTSIEFADQCGLNAVINGRWIAMHPKFNLLSSHFQAMVPCNTYGLDEVDEAKKNPAIIHYTGSSKPWHYMNKHPYKHLYWQYLSETPYAGFKPDGYCFKNIIRKHTPGYLKCMARKMMPLFWGKSGLIKNERKDGPAPNIFG